MELYYEVKMLFKISIYELLIFFFTRAWQADLHLAQEVR